MVQRIIAKCGKGASARYCVRWQSYTAKDDTWLLRSNLGGALDRLTEFEASASAKNKAKAKLKAKPKLRVVLRGPQETPNREAARRARPSSPGLRPQPDLVGDVAQAGSRVQTPAHAC